MRPSKIEYPEVSCWSLDGRKMVAYVRLREHRPGKGRLKCEEVLPNVIVDRYRGKVVGVEFVSPDHVTKKDMNLLSRKLGIPCLAKIDVPSIPITYDCRTAGISRIRPRKKK